MQHKHTAQGLASLGRGPDTELVHMTKGEVHGLQKLAMSQGGSLTINPDTGLVEAGFLSSILPMIAGAAAMYFTGGTAAPLIAGMSNAAVIGAGIGGVTTLATGSLEKGLMAGLGAYGGAGLTSGVMAAGAGGAGTVGAAEAAALTPPVAPTAGIEALAAAPANVAAPVADAGFASQVMPSQAGLAPAQTAALPVDTTGYGYLDKAMQVPPATSVAPMPTVTPTVAAPPAVAPPVAGARPLNYDAYDFGRAPNTLTPSEQLTAGLRDVTSSGTKAMDFASQNKGALLSTGIAALGSQDSELNAPPVKTGMIRPYTFNRTQNEQPDALTAQYTPGQSTRERSYFNDQFIAGTPYKAPGPEYMAAGGPVEQMSNANAIGANTGYPMADIHTGAYATPFQQPMSQNVVQGAQDSAVDPYTGQAMFAAGGGVSNLGGYSDGGQLLRGPGDGVSDSIPAMIGRKQQARLADGEFVVPARIVSELGNGSTEAGSRQLYAMMDRIQKARKKSIGKGKVATNSRAAKLLPA